MILINLLLLCYWIKVSVHKQNTCFSYFKVFHYSIYQANFRTKGKSACVLLTALQKYSKMEAKQAETGKTKKRKQKIKTRENRSKSSANALSRNWLFPLFNRKEKTLTSLQLTNAELRVWKWWVGWARELTSASRGLREYSKMFLLTCFVYNKAKVLNIYANIAYVRRYFKNLKSERGFLHKTWSDCFV